MIKAHYRVALSICLLVGLEASPLLAEEGKRPLCSGSEVDSLFAALDSYLRVSGVVPPTTMRSDFKSARVDGACQGYEAVNSLLDSPKPVDREFDPCAEGCGAADVMCFNVHGAFLRPARPGDGRCPDGVPPRARRGQRLTILVVDRIKADFPATLWWSTGSKPEVLTKSASLIASGASSELPGTDLGSEYAAVRNALDGAISSLEKTAKTKSNASDWARLIKEIRRVVAERESRLGAVHRYEAVIPTDSTADEAVLSFPGGTSWTIPIEKMRYVFDVGIQFPVVVNRRSASVRPVAGTGESAYSDRGVPIWIGVPKCPAPQVR